MPPCPAPDTCWLWLIRHGATDNNHARPPRLQGQGVDAELSEEGTRQARQTAALLAECQADTVYSSPLLRARQTAQLIAEPHQLAVKTVDELIEVDVGQWEGRPWDEIERDWPEAYRAFVADAGVNPYLGGETLTDVQARVTPVFERLLAENLGRQIIVIAHSVVNRTYLAGLIGASLAQHRAMPQDNCGVNLLHHRRARTKLVTLNSIRHLS